MVRNAVKRFAAEESGAVTVDWVVLTGGVMLMVLAVFSIIQPSSVGVGATAINNALNEASDYGT